MHEIMFGQLKMLVIKRLCVWRIWSVDSAQKKCITESSLKYCPYVLTYFPSIIYMSKLECDHLISPLLHFREIKKAISYYIPMIYHALSAFCTILCLILLPIRGFGEIYRLHELNVPHKVIKNSHFTTECFECYLRGILISSSRNLVNYMSKDAS